MLATPQKKTQKLKTHSESNQVSSLHEIRRIKEHHKYKISQIENVGVLFRKMIVSATNYFLLNGWESGGELV